MIINHFPVIWTSMHSDLERIAGIIGQPNFPALVVSDIFHRAHGETPRIIYDYNSSEQLEDVNRSLSLWRQERSKTHPIIVVDEAAICQHLGKEELSDEEMKKLPFLVLVKLLTAEGPGERVIDSLEFDREELKKTKQKLNDPLSRVLAREIDKVAKGKPFFDLSPAIVEAMTTCFDQRKSPSVVVLPSETRQNYRPWSSLINILRNGQEHSGRNDTLIIVRSPKKKIGRGADQWGDGHYEYHFTQMNVLDEFEELPKRQTAINPDLISQTVKVFEEALSPENPSEIRVVAQPSGGGKSSVLHTLAKHYRLPMAVYSNAEALDKRLTRWQPGDPSLIVVDEAHTLTSQTASKLVQFASSHPDVRLLLLCHDSTQLPEEIKILRADPAVSGQPVTAAFFGQTIQDLPRGGGMQRYQA